MKHIKNKFIICSLMTFTLSTQVYSMGAMRPKTSSTTNITTTTSKLGNALPLIENLLPLFGSVSPILGSVLPLFGNLLGSNNLSSQAGTLANLGNLGNILTAVETITSALKPTSVATPVGGPYVDQITELASTGSCANYSWKNKGVAPAGYVKGVALSFARSVCRLKKAEQVPSALATVLGSAISKNTTTDALAFYKNIFSTLTNTLTTKGEEPLRAVYSLGLGLGMQLSSGSSCGAIGSIASGVFPVSNTSLGFSTVLSNLYSEYKTNDSSRCFLDVFNEGTSCVTNPISGTGTNAQAFANSCPAFATEFAMTLLRLNRSGLGSISSNKVEVVPSCDQLLQNVQDLIDRDPENACQDIF